MTPDLNILDQQKVMKLEEQKARKSTAHKWS